VYSNMKVSVPLDENGVVVSVVGYTKKKKIFIFCIGFSLLFLIGFMVKTWWVYTHSPTYIANQKNTRAHKEADLLVSAVSKLVILPRTKTLPQIISINDPITAIKNQPTLAGVIAGDKILVYFKESRAIVYSPSRHKIVTILPISTERSK
jgi:hypothetical protein